MHNFASISKFSMTTYSVRMPRCPWATTEKMIAYHDDEWGRPCHDDRALFEFLILEGAQAGLSWETILNKRENYRKAFAEFDPVKVARFTPRKIESLLKDPGIVRNRLKVQSAVRNAQAYLEIQREQGSFDAWLWSFVDGRPIDNKPRSVADIPASSALSDSISKALKKRGFNFVGSTIIYAYLQAVGVVNDHLVACPARRMNGR